MNKLFKFTQAKGKWHKFPSFNLGGGAKLYKNFAQKLLAVSLCTAVVLLGTPVTTFATATYTLEYSDATQKKITGVTASNHSLVTTIEIPATVTEIAEGAFDACTNLETFTVAGGTAFSVDDSTGALYSYSDIDAWSTLYRLPPAFTGTYTLPASVSTIKYGAFTNCSLLEKFNFGSASAVLSWSDYSFTGCQSLASFAGDRPGPAVGVYDSTLVSSGGALCSVWSEDGDQRFRLLRVAPGARAASLPVVHDSPPVRADGSAFAGLGAPFPLLLSDPDMSPNRLPSVPGLVVFCCDESLPDEPPFPVFAYSRDSLKSGRLLLTSGAATESLTLACDTFDGYTLALADDAPDLNLTITHSGTPGTTCSACGATIPTAGPPDGGAGDVAPDPGADFLHDTVHVDGKPQRLRVYDPNGVLPADTTFKAEYVDGSHGDHNFFITHLDPATDVELQHFYNLTLTSAGQTLSELDGPVELWFEAIDGIDAADSFISRVAEGADAKLTPTLYTDADGVTWIKVLTDHFSPYALTDLLSEEEKATLAKGNSGPKNNVKTGDLAVQVAAAGLGMTLVLALGIMLRLITNKRKFEE